MIRYLYWKTIFMRSISGIVGKILAEGKVSDVSTVNEGSWA